MPTPDAPNAEVLRRHAEQEYAGELDALARPPVGDAGPTGGYYLQAALRAAALRLHPSLAEHAMAALTELAERETVWAESVDRTLALLRFRREMLDDLAAADIRTGETR